MYAKTLTDLSQAIGVSRNLIQKFDGMKGYPTKVDQGYNIAAICFWIAANPKATQRHKKILDFYRQDDYQEKDNQSDYQKEKVKQQGEWTKVKKERESLRLERDKEMLIEVDKVEDDWLTLFNIIKRRVLEVPRQAATKVLDCENITEAIETIEDKINSAYERIQEDFNSINQKGDSLEEIDDLSEIEEIEQKESNE